MKAFNEDKPYDRFIREQIAGDEMYPESVEAHIATGFLRHYTDETNQPSMELRREELLQNITDTVSTAFMGLTYAGQVPQPQVRSDSAEGLLPASGVL